jgi:hypothetical protein
VTGETLRLRPGVHATSTVDGLHLRSWSSTLLVRGGADLATLWERLLPALRAGVPATAIAGLTGRTGAWRAAGRLMNTLLEHDMLLADPPAWRVTGERVAPAGVAAWLEQTTEPARAWHRCAAAVATVTGEGPVATAALDALRTAGLTAVEAAPVDRRLTVLSVSDQDGRRISAGADKARGFVTSDGAGAIADRLGLGDREPDELFATAVGAAAAHRFVTALAEHPVPDRDPVPWPEVLVFDGATLRASRHHWLGAGSPVPSVTVTRALDALTDSELGVLPEPDTRTVPQLPAALATNPGVLGHGASLAAARLDATLRTVERLLDPRGTGRFAVGVDVRHATGIALRRAVLEIETAHPPRTHDCTTDPLARRWWSALVRRFGVPARVTVAPRAPGVLVATVHADGRILASAVEATADDAAATALLAAVAAEQARRAQLPPDTGALTACGARPTGRASWDTTGRTGVWPDLLPAEDALQDALRRFVPAGRHPRPVDLATHGELGVALRAVGWSVLASGSAG